MFVPPPTTAPVVTNTQVIRTPKEQYDRLIDFLKVLHKPENQENAIISDEIKETLESLFALISAVVEINPKSPATMKHFAQSSTAFEEKVLKSALYFKIHMMMPDSTKSFFSELKKIFSSLSDKTVFFMHLKKIFKEEFEKTNSTYGYSGEVFVNFLKELATPKKVKEEPKYYSSSGGENSFQIDKDHWNSGGAPGSVFEGIHLTSKSLREKYPSYILDTITQHCTSECDFMDTLGRLPQSSMLISQRENRFQFTLNPIIDNRAMINCAFYLLVLREIVLRRLDPMTYTSAKEFIISYIERHPNFHASLIQAAGWGQNMELNLAVIREEMMKVLITFVREGDLRDDANIIKQLEEARNTP